MNAKSDKKKIEKAISILKKLNQYLPDHFPEVEQYENYIIGITIKDIAKITTEDSNLIRFRYDEFYRNKNLFQIFVLCNFVLRFDGNPYSKFEFAGLPFRFEVNQFIKSYLGASSRVRLGEILDLMGVKGYKTYFTGEHGHFDEKILDELIKDVFERKNKNDMTVLSMSKWIGIDVEVLKEYLRLNPTNDIFFNERKKRVYWRTMEK